MSIPRVLRAGHPRPVLVPRATAPSPAPASGPGRRVTPLLLPEAS